MIIKIVTILILITIVGSLFSALLFLLKDKRGSDRTVKALTMRIGLSIFLFLGLITAAHFGYIGHTL
ncbi:twin transmembrane helix small protein [Methylophilus medardicus]|uniref:Twin transmembrane helix small protein n=1 Tax=Methylophilus medardicus TaxID=2588534 RepID=A0A5B8CV65_9PROT|nr:twin transmembrane helix small protein [Methylophilus medardicus]QDC44805.1 twin transmembrane helix small protein [Methylophilus medardicus]QDC49812.1 twin transmembrane helix small protein [Methylophilus medardicus]QDC53517.1 twin transmembrane helix small protein [Methylophilus medardicus]